jgi:ATP-dependent Clp protease protease subunit
MKDNAKVQAELAKLCGQPLVKIQTDMKRDFYLTAAEATAYGLIDKVLAPFSSSNPSLLFPFLS